MGSGTSKPGNGLKEFLGNQLDYFNANVSLELSLFKRS
jgi:hypothetical protein